MKLSQVLFSQGFGSRRECHGLIVSGRVAVGGAVCEDPDHEVEPEGFAFDVNGERWAFQQRALIVLNKPAAYECSQKPKHHPSVYALLPAPLRRRDVQAVGRLDEDTTGLLLFTDDGQLIHRWTSPKTHLPKVYEVGCKHPLDPSQLERLLAGVVLHDSPAPVRALACQQTGPEGLRLTLGEGKFHQVKRMVAAVGNRVETLHRSAFGSLSLPEDLAVGQWCWLPGPEAVETPSP